MIDLKDMLGQISENYRARESIRQRRKTHYQRLRDGKRSGKLESVDSEQRILQRSKGLASVSSTSAPLSDARLFEALIDQNEMVGVDFLRRGFEAAQAVARVVVQRKRLSDRTNFGTAFLISPQLAITNNHVVPDPATAMRTVLEFGYVDSALAQKAPTSFKLQPARFFASSDESELDFSIIAVEPESAGVRLSEFGFHRLIAESGKAIAMIDHVNILHHPGARPMSVTLRRNRVLDIDDDGPYMYYEADTEQGSSGAPCFNVNWEVAALHHMGVARTAANPDDPDKPHILLTNGKVWDGRASQLDEIDYISNRGVRISAIVQNMNARKMVPAQRALWDQCLDDIPKPTAGNLEKRAIVPITDSRESRELIRVVENADGGISCYVRTPPR